LCSCQGYLYLLVKYAFPTTFCLLTMMRGLQLTDMLALDTMDDKTITDQLSNNSPKSRSVSSELTACDLPGSSHKTVSDMEKPRWWTPTLRTISSLFTGQDSFDDTVSANQVPVYLLNDDFQPIDCMLLQLVEPKSCESPTFALEAKSAVDSDGTKQTIHLLLAAQPSDEIRFTRVILNAKFLHPGKDHC